MTDIQPEQNLAPPDFYVVSKRKLILLTLATFGGYFAYWSYLNWRYYKISTQQKLYPVWRAFFAVFFTHSLFQKIDEKIKANGLSYPWSPRNQASLIVLILIVIRVLEKLVEK